MTASTPEEVEAYRLLALRGALKLESVGLKTSKGKSAFSIVKKMTGLPGRSAKELLPLYEDLLREYGILSLKKTMTNPAHRKNPTKELMTIPPEDWLEEAERRERAGDRQGAKVARQFAHFLMGQKDAFENPRKNPIRQRIAVSLNKARRNPFPDRNVDE